ncbi:molybdopterin converting factor subunit 1 [Jeongeupia chitinilytica]|uniref:Molybdopterin synthase sulfur carrier subunit n=1 Tax=Jeongeupia chitinilytica TaxID=1041641 RepID=A0ABQ3GYU8_9NEIS|nr:molybdopterin converting factor subunit 1 [Jeongeupia chitinilytica]GHD61831.1 molybdopterin synthase sulfur carrier subunit [Jeongeupia chitinilytica]
MNTVQLLYFARLRDVFGLHSETLTLPEGSAVADLIARLVARGGAFADELGGARVFRVAVNQEMARPDDPIPAGAEVAIFPPVTGG